MNNRIRWFRLPNGKLLAVDAQNRIETSVVIDADFNDGPEAFLDALSEAVTGSEVGLESFDYTAMGDSTWRVTGSIASLLHENGDAIEELVPGTDGFAEAFAQAFKDVLSAEEVSHAIASLGTHYENEAIIPLPGGRELRFPAPPEDCSYVRITLPSIGAPIECAYWVQDEWEEDPQVMGAILGRTRACEVRQ